MPETLVLRDVGDVVSLAPFVVGYVPSESVVTMSLRAMPSSGGDSAASVLGMSARVDLADVVSDPVGVGLRIAGHLERDGSVGVLILLYAQDTDMTAMERIRDFVRVVYAQGAPVLDCVLVTGESWRSVTEPGYEQHPVGTHSAVAAHMVAAGAVAAPSKLARLAMVQQAAADDPVRADATTYLAALDGRVDTAAAFADWEQGVAWALSCQTGDPGGEPLTGQQVAELAAALSQARFRDALLVDTVQPVAGGLEALMDAVDTQETFTGTMRPQRTRVAARIDVLALVARSVEGAARSDALGALSWVLWYSGDLGLASDVADIAVKLNSGQSMALLVQQVAAAGMPPMWAVNPSR